MRNRRVSDLGTTQPSTLRLRRVLWALLIALTLFSGLELIFRVTGFASPEPLLARRQYGPLDVYELSPKFPAQVFPVEKDPSTRRIFVLGGSTTAGFPYSNQGSFSNFLRLQLQHQFPNLNLEIVNFGLAGLGSDSVLDHVRELQAFDPDIFVIYTGHEEFAVVPRGVPLWISDLRIVRAIQRRTQPTPQRIGTRLDDRGYAATLAAYRENLVGIVEAAGEVPVVLCEVVSNLLDHPPFASEFASGTTVATRALISDGLEGLTSTFADVAQLREWVRLDSSYAEMRFRLGRALLRSGNGGIGAEAVAELRMARDLDVSRARASSAINTIIRDVARQTASIVVSLERPFARAAASGDPDLNLFHDHLHPSLLGNYGIASSIAARISGAGWLGPGGGIGALPMDQAIREAGLTELDHAIADQALHDLTQRWPFPESNETYQSRRDAEVERVARTFRDSGNLAEAHMELGTSFLEQDRLAEAFSEYRTAALLFPVVSERFRRAGEVAHRLGRMDEARKLFRRAATLDPASGPPEVSASRREDQHNWEAVLGIGKALADLETLHVWQESGDRVVVLDENGNGVADRIEDLYLYDLGSDGSFDRVVDWSDLNGNGEADRQSIFYLSDSLLGPGLTGFVIEHFPQSDSGDGRRDFWATLGGRYVQATCQYRCDFHGPSFFSQIWWDPVVQQWNGLHENPFCFYDPDGDGRSEEALRVSGSGRSVWSIRWSFDTDDDAPGPSPARLDPANYDDASGQDFSRAYDYDLSLTAITQTQLSADAIDTLRLRNDTRLPLLSWDHARRWAVEHSFDRVLLTFDENDRNIDPADAAGRDRWEGVIGRSPGDGMPQVGNPNCGALNKRYEVRDGSPHPAEIYFSEVDGRIHLRGASRGWIDIDHDEDGAVDDRLTLRDEDGDGFFDQWLWDAGANGQIDEVYDARRFEAAAASYSHPVPIEFESLRTVERRVLAQTGWSQGERFHRESEIWRRLGRFVPMDSLRAF